MGYKFIFAARLRCAKVLKAIGFPPKNFERNTECEGLSSSVTFAPNY